MSRFIESHVYLCVYIHNKSRPRSREPISVARDIKREKERSRESDVLSRASVSLMKPCERASDRPGNRSIFNKAAERASFRIFFFTSPIVPCTARECIRFFRLCLSDDRFFLFFILEVEFFFFLERCVYTCMCVVNGL